MKKIFKIDAALYPFGILIAVTGFCFHIAGHGGNHHVWVLWAYTHTILSVIFVVSLVEHLLTHKAWVKALRKGTATRKQGITLLLAIIALAVIISGMALLAIVGANTHIGLLHYKLGILLTLFAVGHAAKRWGILRKAIGNGQQKRKQ